VLTRPKRTRGTGARVYRRSAGRPQARDSRPTLCTQMVQRSGERPIL